MLPVTDAPEPGTVVEPVVGVPAFAAAFAAGTIGVFAAAGVAGAAGVEFGTVIMGALPTVMA
jgi:hypothetical protein